MAAIARIDFGLAEGEFWRLTPRQFHEYAKRHAECDRREWTRVRFLATAIGRAFGADVDYMEEAPDPEPSKTPEEAAQRADVFGMWLRARAEADKRRASRESQPTPGESPVEPQPPG